MNLPDELIPDRALVLDRWAIRRLYEWRTAHGNDPCDEMWDGMLVFLPLFDNEHQRIRGLLGNALLEVVSGMITLELNVSDRASDWLHNYRCPDVVAYLDGNPAVNHQTHMQGGPDFLVEIVSPGERPHEKLPFYAEVGTKEVVIVDRDPWAVEKFQLRGRQLELVGRSDFADPAVLQSSVLPLTFRLTGSLEKPRVEVFHPPTNRTWLA